MDFAIPKHLEPTLAAARDFIEGRVMPCEPQLLNTSFADMEPKLDELRAEVKRLTGLPDDALRCLKRHDPKDVRAVLETIEDHEWVGVAQYDAAMDVSQTIRVLLGLEKTA